MQSAEMRAFSPAELHSRIDDAREELFKLRFQTAFGQATDTSQFRKTRREIAPGERSPRALLRAAFRPSRPLSARAWGRR